MTELECNVTNCANNFGNHCCRPDIKVGGPCACGDEQTFCSNFLDKEDSACNAIACHAPNETLQVSCNAKNCKYYGSGDICTAEHIQVNNCSASGSTESERQTQCSTFEMQ